MYDYLLISETCEALGLSHRDVSKATNISEATISRYMRGEVKDATFDTVDEITKFLNLSMDVVAGRETVTELPVKEGSDFTQNLILVRDMTRHNTDRVRTMEREKDGIYLMHINHLTEQLKNGDTASAKLIDHLTTQLNKYSKQFFRYNVSIYALIAFSATMLGIMIMMFVNNRSLQGRLEDCQAIIAEYNQQDADDDYPDLE